MRKLAVEEMSGPKALMTLATLAMCLFGFVMAMQGCYRQPAVAPFDASIIESVLNQPRPASLAPGDPEPPRVFLDTTYKAPAGKTIKVMAGGGVQAAIDQARPGDRKSTRLNSSH